MAGSLLGMSSACVLITMGADAHTYHTRPLSHDTGKAGMRNIVLIPLWVYLGRRRGKGMC